MECVCAGLMFAILHFVAVKKPWLGNTLALSETVRSEVVSLLPLTVRQPNVLGGAYGGTKAKPLAPCCRRLCLFEPLLFMTPPFPAALGLLIISQF
jgi:hypothetical protein